MVFNLFDSNVLNALHKINPKHKLGFLVRNKESIERNLSSLYFKPALYNLYHKFVSAKLNEVLFSKEIHLLPWPVNSIEKANRLAEMGITKMITDYPNRFL